MEYNNNVGKNTIEEIYKLFDNGYAMREISEKFNTSFSYVQKLIKSRNYEQQLNENYSQREGFKIIAVCKKTNKSFDDYMNKSGTITKHLKSIFPDLEILSNFKLKSIEYETGKFWYDQYFDFKYEEENPKLTCKLCGWSTEDVENRSGAFVKHLQTIHNITIDEYEEMDTTFILPNKNVSNDAVNGTIYMLKNKVNGKIYIGQTTRELSSRIYEHKRCRKSNSHLSSAIKKYGFDNFEVITLDTATTIQELNEKEYNYIKQYNSINKTIGYNIEQGGRNSLVSDETRDKMSKAGKGKKHDTLWVNKNVPPKGSQEALKYGRPKTDEQKKYLSENSPKYWQGKKRDEETVRKMTETKKAKGITEKQKEAYCRKVYRKNVKTGEIKEFYSINDAMRESGHHFNSLTKYLNEEAVVKCTLDGQYYLWSFNELT